MFKGGNCSGLCGLQVDKVMMAPTLSLLTPGRPSEWYEIDLIHSVFIVTDSFVSYLSTVLSAVLAKLRMALYVIN